MRCEVLKESSPTAVTVGMQLNPAERAVIEVGIDLVAVDSVREAINAHATRYLDRVYTRQELADCRAADGTTDVTRLAGRFAAKEATMKVLRVGDEPLPWTSIAVTASAKGAPRVELSGAAATLARQRGVGRVAVSVSHEGALAIAVAVGEAA
jgi:holo-[acyl-carrier protein] synthase